jgi:farnesyl-diphosphate farnesyltransferase
MLAALRDRISGTSTQPLNFERFAGSGQLGSRKTSRSAAASSGERDVLVRIEEFLGCLVKLSEPDRELVRRVLSTIISGQELDLRRFATAGPDHIVALRSGEELDDYTYRVAGCVGEFWTRICRAHLFPEAKLDESALFENGIRFGKGLQLVNVLRDLPADLRQGRCYLPIDRLQKLGLNPQDLLKTDSYGRLQPLYYELLTLTETYLAAGWEYTNTLPRRCIRLRLACAWPVLIGSMTLRKLHSFNVLDATQRVKVSRSEVRRIMAGTIIGQFVPFIWRRLFARAKLV